MPDDKLRTSWLPLPHFMALAPLDVWLRLLLRRVRLNDPRYVLRAGLGLTTSLVGTAITLPERLLLWPFLWFRFGRGSAKLHHKPGVVIITGYYRTGTTHLHYLMSCDPAMRTPRWVHVSAPQGFALSWFLIRWLMIPFVSNSRPQDDVAFGPEWPSEDDFALNNWNLTSSLPGRFIVPSQYDNYMRFHDFRGLNDRERRRWRWAQAAFCWKLLAFSPGRKLLLKTPSHTARLGELSQMFGPGLRIVHLARDPDAVVKSNVRMAERLEPYSLEPMPSSETTRARVVEEFVRTEREFLEQAAELKPGQVAMLRFKDLIADPLGQLRRCYDELGLEWTDQAEKRFRRYLGAVRDYTPRHTTAADGRQREPELEAMAARFGIDEPPVERVELEHGPEKQQQTAAVIATVATAIATSVAWHASAAVLHDRIDPLMWVFGVVIGLVAVRTAGRGSLKLGILAAAATFVACVGSFVTVSWVAHHDLWAADPWRSAWRATRQNLTAFNNLLFLTCGVVSAFRIGTRQHVKPPGS